MTDLYLTYTYGLDPGEFMKSSEAMGILTNPIRPTAFTTIEAAQAYVQSILDYRHEPGEFDEEYTTDLDWKQIDEKTWTTTVPGVSGWTPEVYWIEKVELPNDDRLA
jgi:hypothetical protein